MARKDPPYFIAILPPAEISEEVTSFKQYIADECGARHAFKSPPHITLQPPFTWPDQDIGRLTDFLQEFVQTEKSFYLELKNFGAFPPRVLYVKPVDNDALHQLFKRLILAMESQLQVHDPRNHSRPFRAHMTIAHRDLDEQDFPGLWEHFSQQQYARMFKADALALLKHQDGMWHVSQTFAFK